MKLRKYSISRASKHNKIGIGNRVLGKGSSFICMRPWVQFPAMQNEILRNKFNERKTNIIY
jgi:hypothetical protein